MIDEASKVPGFDWAKMGVSKTNWEEILRQGEGHEKIGSWIFLKIDIGGK